jgi:hypothetical protein
MGPSSMLNIIGFPLDKGAISGLTLSMVPSIGGCVSTQSLSKSSQASSIDMPPASGVSSQASSINMPPVSGISSQISSINILLAMPNMGIPTANALGLHHTYISIHLLTLITDDKMNIVVSLETGNVMLTLQHRMVWIVI